MGNEGSKLKGLEIDKNAVEVNDFWALYNAESLTTTTEEGKQSLSVFQGEPVVSGQLWLTQGPMERAIKNLMIYRHPYILKYVTTWEQGGQKHLATERVRPLVAVLQHQTNIQVCLGLRTILCSLIFLIEKAMARHLNICTQSIYVTDSGSWRLAGFEYVWKSKDVTRTLLDLAKSYRYQTAIDPCETRDQNIDAIEQYAFATLCEEILTKCGANRSGAAATPHVEEFREYCATHLQHKNAQMRPKLSAVLLHPYFNHEFVLIHSFLFELPLKSAHEKQDFFTSLVDRLRYFDEDMVGRQFAGDLLSRMVLLDPTAQLCVTPYVLRTKADHTSALFSGATYSRHLMPHILKMFRLRDAQIRLILLEYFMDFVRLLSKEELQQNILPHLLIGMQDTNDVLVAKTLRCLADLVPLLGSATVLGGQRSRLFSDGRPHAAVSDVTTHWVEPRSITPVLGANNDCPMVSGSPVLGHLSNSGSLASLPQTLVNEQYEQYMSPRLSPDGGEDVNCEVIIDGASGVADVATEEESLAVNVTTSNTEHIPEYLTQDNNKGTHVEACFNVEKEIKNKENEKEEREEEEEEEEEEEPWSDWENDELQHLNEGNNEFAVDHHNAVQRNGTSLPFAENMADSLRTTKSSLRSAVAAPQIVDDLTSLDIKVQKSVSTQARQGQGSEFDFFKDMEPVIETKQNRYNVSNMASEEQVKFVDTADVVVDSSRFAAHVAESDDGWHVDDDDDDDDDDDGDDGDAMIFADVPTTLTT